MPSSTRYRLALVTSAAALTLLTACGRQEEPVASAPTPAATAPNADSSTGMTGTTGTEATTASSSTEGAPNSIEATAERAGQAAERGVEAAVTATGDATLTAKVKTALITAPDLSAMKIDVDTSNGVVTLQGEVKNTAEKVRPNSWPPTSSGSRRW